MAKVVKKQPKKVPTKQHKASNVPRSSVRTAKSLQPVKAPRQRPKRQTPKRQPKPITLRQRLRAFANGKLFGRLYVMFAVGTLAATTAFWSLLGSKIQQSNADQLVDPYLFDSWQTFRSALFPGAHTFLIKWPLFLLIRLFNFSSAAYVGVTIAVVMVTVGVLAAVLYRMERRLLVFGTLILALASTLLLIPAQPYPGALLPVNIAMLATRNLEYVAYLASLALFLHAPSFKQWRFWVGVGLLTLLAASDKLFLYMAVGAGGMALLAYGLARRKSSVKIAAGWLALAVLSGAGALALLWALRALHVTHIVGQSDSGPYQLTMNSRQLGLAGIYGLLGLLTNFGANPAFNATVLHAIPREALTRLTSLAGVGFVVNLAIMAFGVFAAWRVLRGSFMATSKKLAAPNDAYANLATMLVWSTLVAIILFGVTNHYYAVDARYLTISLFAVFVVLASYLRGRRPRTGYLLLAGLLMSVGMVSSLPFVWQTYQKQQSAFNNVNNRNASVVQALANHRVSTLIGDYWRVIPIRQASGNTQQVLPLASCAQVRNTLSSQAWQPNLHHGFAYLLSLEPSLTGYPACARQEMKKLYGQPNASIVIAGTLAKPTELLALYDHGINHELAKATANTHQPSGTIVPVALNNLPSPTCSGSTIMQIVAHQDDDLLFMNPDMLHDIKAGNCIRTVYVTAGDAGGSKFYWLSREQGSEAAYNDMAGLGNDLWIRRTVKLADQEYIVVTSPQKHPEITLIFMHLPDGNINGKGFPSSNFESLQRLDIGRIQHMDTTDGQSSYTSLQLTDALENLMRFYDPAAIRTQANYLSYTYPDHSDHMAVGRYTKKAFAQFQAQRLVDAPAVPLLFYIGYPIHARAANVTDGDLEQKEAAFFQYARFDGGVCHDLEECSTNSVYSIYLHRQYLSDE